MNKTPKLRFKEFSGDWESKKLGELGEFFKGSTLSKANLSEDGKPCILYGELYTKYGEVIKNAISKTNLDDSKLVIGKKNDVLIPSSGESAIDIATASCLQQDDVILGGDLNVFRSDKLNGVFASYQLNNSKRHEIAKLAQGASVVHVYNTQLSKLKLSVPSKEEQGKIAPLFSLIDDKISLQGEKVEALKDYKKGIMQKIFSKKIRFKDDDGRDYPEWESKKLSEVLIERKENNTGNLRVCSVAVRKGVLDQIEHLGRSFAAKDTSNYNLVKHGDVIYTKSPTGDFPYGIIKQSFLNEDVVVSPLYGVFEPLNFSLGYILHCYFYYRENTNNYLYSIVQKGAKNTINITNTTFLSKSLVLPIDKDEQIKISSLLIKIDNKIEKEQDKLDSLNEYKKGLLQQMFV
ncbi:MAG: restriction endonuclease subunit S [Terrisporobacter sp.]